MKDFFKMMFASMLGFVLVSIIIFFILIGLVITVVSLSSPEEVSISPKTILHLEFDKQILDRSPKSPIVFDLSSMSKKTGLNDILKNIKKAKDDRNIVGIYLDISTIPAGISTITEIRNALIDFKNSGKFIYSYSEDYSQSAYYLATVADKIYLNTEGSMILKGINAELFFLKGTLDKLDVKVQVIRHGKFKAATEPFFLDKMSPENREQMSALIKGVWNNVLQGISETRKISVERLNHLADSLTIRSANDALKYKLIDKLAYKDELIQDIKEKISIGKKDKITLISNEKYTNVSAITKDKSTRGNKIAIIYATGTIGGGDGDDQSIGSEGMSSAIRKAREDDNVKAIVFRVNSGGGDALASDVIWREIELASKSKPVVASFGDVAASGGYYISCAATKIIADLTTITGSIGVFGLVPNMKGLFNNKLGITFDNAKTNQNSDYISTTSPLSTFQTMVLQNQIEKIYSTFITKVAEGRHLKLESVDSIAQGRVWGAIDAKKIGLVDDFGGIDKAIETAAELAKIKDYRIMSLPEQKDIFSQLFDELLGNTRSSYIEKELGEDYHFYQYLKQVKEMKGVQARMPFEIIIN